MLGHYIILMLLFQEGRGTDVLERSGDKAQGQVQLPSPGRRMQGQFAIWCDWRYDNLTADSFEKTHPQCAKKLFYVSARVH